MIERKIYIDGECGTLYGLDCDGNEVIYRFYINGEVVYKSFPIESVTE